MLQSKEHLTRREYTWMWLGLGLRDGEGRVSGNPLGGVNSVTRFDDVTAVAALCVWRTGVGEGSTGNKEY